MTSSALDAPLSLQPLQTVSTAVLGQFPDSLKSGLFCCWKRVPRASGKISKVPVNIHKGRPAHADCTDHFGSFEDALAYLKLHPKCAGLGRRASYRIDHVIAVDVDNVRDIETGELNAYAVDLIHRVCSYWEVTPSLKGIRIFVKGTLPDYLANENLPKIISKAGNPGGLEVQLFLNSAYVTVTGDGPCDQPVVENQEFLDYLLSGFTPSAGRVAAASLVSISSQPKTETTGIGLGQPRPATVNFWIKRLKATNSVFAQNWFHHSDKGSKKSDSEYQWDLVNTAYHTCQRELTEADMAYMLQRWCKLNKLASQTKLIHRRMPSWYSKSAALWAATGKAERIVAKVAKQREKRAAIRVQVHNTVPQQTTTHVGIGTAQGYLPRGEVLPRILELVAAGGKTQRQIALELGTTAGYVKKVIHQDKLKAQAGIQPAVELQASAPASTSEEEGAELVMFEEAVPAEELEECELWEEPEKVVSIKPACKTGWPFPWPAPKGSIAAAA
jgi:hypothetical protein